LPPSGRPSGTRFPDRCRNSKPSRFVQTESLQATLEPPFGGGVGVIVPLALVQIRDDWRVSCRRDRGRHGPPESGQKGGAVATHRRRRALEAQVCDS
jgi:hypothetical protein